MKITKFTTTTLLASAMLGLSVAGSVQADLFATSVITLDELLFNKSDGSTLDFDTDFVDGTVTFTSSADMDGVLTGTGGYSFAEPNGGDIDFPASCLSTTGDCPVIAENTIPPLILSGPQGTDFVTSDQYQADAPIANLANEVDFPDGSVDFGLGADVVQVAYANLSTTTAEGSANVNNGFEANWEFSLVGADVISIEAGIVTYLEAFASAGEVFPGKASAGTEFVITITDVGGADGGGVIFDSSTLAAFDLLNETTSANANDFPFDIQTCGNLFDIAGAGTGCGNALSVAFSIDTPLLSAENLYQLSIRSNANVDIARVMVPEPSILALLGLGFLGMFLSRRRA